LAITIAIPPRRIGLIELQSFRIVLLVSKTRKDEYELAVVPNSIGNAERQQKKRIKKRLATNEHEFTRMGHPFSAEIKNGVN
jgi:hypothetical protein